MKIKDKYMPMLIQIRFEFITPTIVEYCVSMLDSMSKDNSIRSNTTIIVSEHPTRRDSIDAVLKDTATQGAAAVLKDIEDNTMIEFSRLSTVKIGAREIDIIGEAKQPAELKHIQRPLPPEFYVDNSEIELGLLVGRDEIEADENLRDENGNFRIPEPQQMSLTVPGNHWRDAVNRGLLSELTPGLFGRVWKDEELMDQYLRAKCTSFICAEYNGVMPSGKRIHARNLHVLIDIADAADVMTDMPIAEFVLAFWQNVSVDVNIHDEMSLYDLSLVFDGEIANKPAEMKYVDAGVFRFPDGSALVETDTGTHAYDSLEEVWADWRKGPNKRPISARQLNMVQSIYEPTRRAPACAPRQGDA